MEKNKFQWRGLWTGLLVFLVIVVFIIITQNSGTSPPDLPGSFQNNVSLNESLTNATYDQNETSGTSKNLREDVVSNYLHFNHKNITFAMEGINDSFRTERMYHALKILEEEVGEFSLTEIDDYNNADIKIYFPKRNNLDTIGHATPETDGPVILWGSITMINIEDEDCGDYPYPEIHEILHIFGFDHNPHTIMNAYSGDCFALHRSESVKYVEHLKFIYSNGQIGVEHSELPMFLLQSYCPEGFYEVEGTEYCCPEPNMRIDEGGYCVYL